MRLEKTVPCVYKTVDYIEGIKVLEGINGKHSLPEESHSSSAYIKLDNYGIFKELRIYDSNHFLVKEIAFHPEGKLNNGDLKEKIIHVHEYMRDDFKHRIIRRLTAQEYEEYKKYFKGVPKNAKW